MNSARDLRTQADGVDRSLHNRIICMDEMRQRLENELRTVRGHTNIRQTV